MIQLYTGVPGSGKSYKMVHDLAAFLEKNPKIKVISNIRNLKLPHINFDDLLEKLYPALKLSERIEHFFDYENQRRLNDQYGGPLMYVLDECQLYFPRRGSLPKTEAYLQRHRHLGHFIYLATQSSKLVNSNFVPLIETEYHAARRSISFFGEIHYKEKSPQSNQIIRKLTLRPQKKIFELYQSFEAAEIHKPKPRLFRFFILPLLFIPVFYLFYNHYLNPKSKSSKTVITAQSEGGDYDKIRFERDQLQGRVTELSSQMETIKTEVNKFQRELERKERIFLQVVKVGEKKLTVDPETNAIVELSKIKGRRVICEGGGLNCYYDKPLNVGVILPQPPVQYGGFSQPSFPIAAPVLEPKPKAGPGSFIDASMVPPPDRPR